MNALQVNDQIEMHNTRMLNTIKVNEISENMIRDIFDFTDCLEAVGSDDRKAFWIWEERPTEDEYIDYYMDEEDEEQVHTATLREYYKEDFPDRYVFYEFMSLHNDRGEDGGELYAIFLNGNYILSANDQNARGYPIDDTDFISWLEMRVLATIQKVKDGTYADFIKENLPIEYKCGKIKRKDLWDILPSEREMYRGDFSKEIEDFLSCKDSYNKPDFYLKSMTARNFYEACGIGYAAVGYSAFEKQCFRYAESQEEKDRYQDNQFTPKEMYYIYADGRDDGLMNVPMDDPKAFEDWYNQKGDYFKFTGHHPWEIVGSMRLSHSLHLFVCYEEDKGYYYAVSGRTFLRSIETVLFYLALKTANMPCVIADGEKIAKRFLETDDIEIVNKFYPMFYESNREGCLDAISVSKYREEGDYESIRNAIEEKAIWDKEITVRLKEG